MMHRTHKFTIPNVAHFTSWDLNEHYGNEHLRLSFSQTFGYKLIFDNMHVRRLSVCCINSPIPIICSLGYRVDLTNSCTQVINFTDAGGTSTVYAPMGMELHIVWNYDPVQQTPAQQITTSWIKCTGQLQPKAQNGFYGITLPNLFGENDEETPSKSSTVSPKNTDPMYCQCASPKPKKVDTGMFSVWTICEHCRKELK